MAASDLAAAVAVGMAPLGMGNDGAGFLRWPAQCCGVAALKPSLGRVAQVGAGTLRNRLRSRLTSRCGRDRAYGAFLIFRNVRLLVSQ